MPLCFLCLEKYSLNDFEEHLNNQHFIHDRFAKYNCAEKSCGRMYDSFNSFRYHWLTSHSDHNDDWILRNQSSDSSNVKNLEMSYDDSFSLANHKENINKSEECQTNIQSLTNDCKNERIFYASSDSLNEEKILSEKFKSLILDKSVELNNCSTLSNKHNQMFMNYAKNLVTSGLQIIKDDLEASTGKSNDQNIGLKAICLMNLFCGAFKDLDTEHKRLKILENEGYYIPPLSVFVGNECERVKRTHNGKLKKYFKKSYASFFPLRIIRKRGHRSDFATRKIHNFFPIGAHHWRQLGATFDVRIC